MPLSGKQILRLLALLFLLPAPARPADTLDHVLERMQTGQPRHYHYREVRYMQLLEDEWQSQGDLFTDRQRLVISRTRPQPLLISIGPSRLLYLDPQHGIRRVRALQDDTPIPGITPLLQFFRADHSRTQLEKDFRVRFSNTEEHWTLHLVPANGDNFVRYMEVSGNTGKATDHIHLEFTDEDHTDWFLTLQSGGRQAAIELDALLQRIQKQQP